MTDNPPKTVPNNIDAEAALLGGLLIDPNSRHNINGLQVEDFYLQKHRWIFTAIMDMHRNGEAVDYVTLVNELDRRSQLQAIGGALYLSQLANAVPSAMNISSYARIISDARKRRDVLDMVSEVARLAYREDQDFTVTTDYVQAKLNKLISEQQHKTWQSFADLAPMLTDITWLWQDWIPLGMLTLLGAVAGAGKSMIALDLSKKVMHGEPFPNGARNPYAQGAPVIYVDAEVVPQIIRERAMRWQMDMKKLYLMLPLPNEMVDFSRAEYREMLRSMVSSIKPGMIVIDSLSSITSKGENAIEDVRLILGFLNEIAQAYNCAVVIIHHLRKRGGLQMGMQFELCIDDFRGSSHITAMARSVIGLSVVQVGPDNDPNGPRKLSVLKSNLCRIPDPIGCEFMPLHPTGVFIQWDSAAPEPYRAPTKSEDCQKFLENMLRDTAPMAPKEIVEIARSEGFSRDLVFTARKALGSKIRNTGGYKDPNNQWEWCE
jgi:replicative DNA helicase